MTELLIRDEVIQKSFDETYIQSSEICETLGIARSTLLRGIESGMLPQPIRLRSNQIFLWHRDDVKDNLEAWSVALMRRRKQLRD